MLEELGNVGRRQRHIAVLQMTEDAQAERSSIGQQQTHVLTVADETDYRHLEPHTRVNSLSTSCSRLSTHNPCLVAWLTCLHRMNCQIERERPAVHQNVRHEAETAEETSEIRGC